MSKSDLERPPLLAQTEKIPLQIVEFEEELPAFVFNILVLYFRFLEDQRFK